MGHQFQRDADAPIAFSIAAPVAALESIRLGGEFVDKGVRASTILSAARGSYGGMLMFGMAAGSLLSVTVAAPVMLVLSLGLGRRAVREERTRRHQQHQAEARAALHRYAQEVSLVVGKECRTPCAAPRCCATSSRPGRCRCTSRPPRRWPRRSGPATSMPPRRPSGSARCPRRSASWAGWEPRRERAARDAHGDGVGRVDQRPAGTAGQAASTAPDAEAAAAVDEIAGRLSEPLRVAIAGKVKAGKSTLLNALVGDQLRPRTPASAPAS